MRGQPTAGAPWRRARPRTSLPQIGAAGGWLTSPIRVSGTLYGAPPVWPGDTVGISSLSSRGAVLTWGSGVSISGQPKSEIFAATAQF